MYVRDDVNIGPVPPVAIVGAALRFPGAADPAAFHELTIAGRRTFRELASAMHSQAHEGGNGTRVPLAFPPLPVALPGHEDTGRGGEPGEAASDIPARHVLAAETAAAALADVPLSARPLTPDRIGAIVADIPGPGVRHAGDWVRESLGLTGAAAANGTATSGAKRIARSRRAAERGADGPRGANGTGEASGTRPADGGPHCSLRAIVAACEALNAGAFDLVIAGGVSTGADHDWMSGGAPADSPPGDMRVYDEAPTGTLPGEGCGAVALMRASDAQAAGLPVYAEIVGWHAADGDGGPSLNPAYARAGVDPADVQLLEGHGAATAAEDLDELSTLLDLLGPDARCALGAVSAVIGDTQGAAGVAALLKTALAMTAGIIPPATGCVRPHPLLVAEPAPLRLPAAAEPWPETAVQLAAVNSLGTVTQPGAPRSGAVHLVLRRERDSGYRAGRRRRAASAAHGGTPPAAGPPAPRRGSGAHGAPPPPRVSEDQLLRAVPAPRPGVEITPPRPRTPQDSAPCSGPPGPDVSFSRQGPAERVVVAVGGANREDLAVTLDTIARTAGHRPASRLAGRARELAVTAVAGEGGPRAAIVAGDPGELAARARRAAALLRTAERRPLRAWPGARSRCLAQPPREAAIADAGPGIWVSEMARGRVVLLFPGLATAPLAHMATLAASQATLAVLDGLGVEPRAAVGYSLGELTGLAWAGSITAGEAARLAARRADVLRAAPRRTAMARVLAAPGIAARLRAGTGLVVAVHEGPGQHVLAGPAADIRALPRRAAGLGAAVDVLDAGCALHSPAIRPCEPPWRAVVGGQRFGGPRRRLISAVTGLDVAVSADVSWALSAQLTRPALLAGALALACADADLVVLAAPDPALAAATAACGRGRLPVLSAPLAHRTAPTPETRAALFAVGAIGTVMPAAETGRAGVERTVRSGYSENPGPRQAEAFAPA